MQTPTKPTNDTLLTFQEATEYLRVSRSTLYRLIQRGQVVGHKVGWNWRFKPEDLRGCVQREDIRRWQ